MFILIKNADIYAPEPLGKKDVLLSFDRIIKIDDSLTLDLSGIEVIDAKGKYLVPGFIDQHVHVTGGGGEGGLHSRTPELLLSDAIEAGVTTLVGLLGTDSITRNVESLVAKTKALNNEGITAYCFTSAYQYPPITLTGSVSKDIVFISEVIGCKLAYSDHRGSHPTREELIWLVSEVRRAGLVSGKPGLLHIHIGPAPEGVLPIMDIVKSTDIPIKHFRPTHMSRHPKQAAEFTRMGGYADFTSGKNLPAMFVEVMKESDEKLLTISSDSNGSLPVWDEKQENIIGMGVGKMTSLYNAVREMIVNHNVPIERALTFITSNVAKALELFPRKGSLSPSSDADLVLLDADLNIDTVIAKGKIMMRDKKIIVKGMFES
ncbi:MAG: beta-aspartyl-peptidase [Treponema sp.]|nr:beta-aspartyl-peptidase [Treponema sp.]